MGYGTDTGQPCDPILHTAGLRQAMGRERVVSGDVLCHPPQEICDLGACHKAVD